MHTGTAGKCDTCDAGIPCGAPFRVRHMTPEAVDDAFADAEPATRVSAPRPPRASRGVPCTKATPASAVGRYRPLSFFL